MRVVVTGGSGQLGQALRLHAPKGTPCFSPTRQELDLTDAGSTAKFCADAKPDVIVNAAAYTQVDLAETEAEEAFAVNAEGVKNLAQIVAQHHARLIQISTDFVFDGSLNRAYRPSDRPKPISVYGRSKLAGEDAAQDILANRALIVRTSWLYGPTGANFLNTMLRLLAANGAVRVVNDQIGCPTSTAGLAKAVWAWVEQPDASGIRHWSDCGIASWYDFAMAISEEAEAMEILEQPGRIEPIPTEEYPTPATRPKMSILDGRESRKELTMDAVHWRQALRAVLRAQAPRG